MRPEIRYNERFIKALSVRENYDSHKRKLSQLTKQKGPYAMNRSATKLQQLKGRKQSSLIRIRNKKLENIDKVNHSLYSRLIESQELHRNTYVANATIAFLKESASQRIEIQKPYFTRKLETTQLENEKLYNRLTTLKSTINNKKIRNDFEASRKRKERISKFEGNSLKNTKLIEREISKRNTSLSSRGIQEKQSPVKDTKTPATAFTRQPRMHSVSMYNHQNILKNRIEEPNILTRNRIKQLQRISFRPFNEQLKTDITKFVDQNAHSSQKRFFATEIQNLKTREPSKKLKHIT